MRKLDLRCEDCGSEQEVNVQDLEEARTLRTSGISRNRGKKFLNRDWSYCADCGGYAFRVWSVPNISFGFVGSTRRISC